MNPVAAARGPAEIVLHDAVSRRVLRGVSDSYGAFVAAVPASRYQVVVSQEGFMPLRTEVEVAPGALVSLGDVMLGAVPLPEAPEPGVWRLDPAHSAVRFAVRHVGLGRVHGRFNAFEGEIHVGELGNFTLQVVIDAASIDTGVHQRDDHLRSADFLDVAHYPTLEFVSDRFVHISADRWAVHGGLTLHGVSRSVTLDTRYLGAGTGMEGERRVACLATTELHREDFTLNWQQMIAHRIAAIGSTIQIELDIQAVRAD
ncbi:YceI family protein [Streptomyces sp. NPDC020801]|uniref:YceI family protein n=1 Tax=unclassified Streptomyces TaxID=2593676 RepID=UPI003789111E